MSKKTGTVVKQASFLMIAGLIVRMIGLLYRSPLNAIIGSVGSGYYTFAYEWYNILLLISSYSIPMAVSKVMAERLATGHYKNAQKIFHISLLYVLVVGGLASLICFFFAPWLCSGQPNAILALRVLAPTILLSGILGVMRGYFQAHNTMMPTAFSQIAEQVVNAVISVLAAYLFTRAVAGDTDVGRLGAAGGTLGTGAGVLTGLLFMLFVYAVNKQGIRKRIQHDRLGCTESNREVTKVILLMVTPVIFATCVYNISGVIDQQVYTSLSIRQGVDAVSSSADLGLYGFQYRTIINIPIALASATSTALIPAIASSFARRDKKDVIEKIDESIRLTMFIAIPSAVGISILSYPIIRILFPGSGVDAPAAAIMLSIGAISIIFYCLSTVTNGILQGLGKPFIPVIHAAIALVINIVTVVILMLMDFGIYSIVFATILYALIVCILNGFSLRSTLGYHNEIKRSYLLPLVASLCMSAGCGIVYWVPFLLLNGTFERYVPNAVFGLLAVLVGILVYVIAYLILLSPNEEELLRMPMGRKLLVFARKLRLV